MSRIVSLMIGALVFTIGAGIPANAQQGSLADAARQARSQRQAMPKSDNSTAQQVADQLSEEQNGSDAPAGFKMYKADGYKVLVPTPFTVVGHDEAGVVVTGLQSGLTQLYVMVGNPLVQRWGNNDDAFHDAAAQFVQIYAPNPKCTKTTVAGHEAYECGLAGAKLLGTSVSGTAAFVRGGGHVYPVFCTAKTESSARDTLNNPRAGYDAKVYAKEEVEREDRDVRAAWKKCDAVLQSITINPSMGQVSGSTNAPAAQTAPAASVAAVTPGAPASLAQVAQQLHQAPGTAVPAVAPMPTPAAENAVPAGLKVHPFTYCKGRDCFNASIYVPTDAQLVNSDCKQYAFEMKVAGAPFLLLAGSSDGCAGRSANDPNQVRWNQLVLPETMRAPGTSSMVSSQGATLDGKPAVITTMKFKAGMADWMGRRAEVDTNGTQVVVGCMAPRDHFADGDAICAALIQSLRLP